MDKNTLYFPVEISGLLGKIAPQIKVTIPQGVIFAVAKGAAKKAVREELKRHDMQLSQADGPVPDTTNCPPLPSGTVHVAQDVFLELTRRRVIRDLLDETSALLERGEISTLDDMLHHLEGMIE